MYVALTLCFLSSRLLPFFKEKDSSHSDLMYVKCCGWYAVHNVEGRSGLQKMTAVRVRHTEVHDRISRPGGDPAYKKKRLGDLSLDRLNVSR